MAVLYATAMIFVAFPSAAHGHEAGQERLLKSKAEVTTFCLSNKHDSGHAHSFCFDSCQLGSTPGLTPVVVAAARCAIEVATRSEFTQRFGHVSDASPDDLRSRAPPRPF